MRLDREVRLALEQDDSEKEQPAIARKERGAKPAFAHGISTPDPIDCLKQREQEHRRSDQGHEAEQDVLGSAAAMPGEAHSIDQEHQSEQRGHEPDRPDVSPRIPAKECARQEPGEATTDTAANGQNR